MILIVGLGNPGKEYENTRHNLGFKVIEELATRLGIPSFKSKFQAFVADAKIDEHKIILMQPQTFMNNSGASVRQIMDWYRIKPENIILIYDDVDLEVGDLRIREKGGAGGHHGIESVIGHIKSTQFIRMRIGIGRDNYNQDVSDYVLANIPEDQRELLTQAVIVAADAIETIVRQDLTVAMNKYNA